MPQWSVREPSLNLMVRDNPLSYRPGRGPKVAFKLIFKNERDTQRDEDAKKDDLFSVGRGWSTPWRQYLLALDGTTNTFKVANGRSGYSTMEVGERHSRNRDIITIEDSTPVLTHSDGSVEVYGKQVTGTEGKVRHFLTQHTDAHGNGLTYEYFTNGTLVLLTNIVDADGRDTAISYTNINDFYLIHTVTDPFGRTAILGYDNSTTPNLVEITDAAGLTSTLEYSSDDLSKLITPYGTNEFLMAQGYSLILVEKALRIKQPDGGYHLFMYLQEGDTNYLADSLAALCPSTTNSGVFAFANTFDTGDSHKRDSFYWDPRQYDLLPGDFRSNLTSSAYLDSSLLRDTNYLQARMRHWLSRTNETESDGLSLSLSLERSPSADGTTPGQITWYDYAGKPGGTPYLVSTNSLPSFKAWLLPNGQSRFVHYLRDSAQRATNVIETWNDSAGNLKVRTNSYVYDANGIDLVKHVGPDGSIEAGYFYNSNHQVLRHTNALEEVTHYTYDPEGRLASVQTPAGLTTTNIYYSSGSNQGLLAKTIDIEIGRTNSYTWTDALVRTHTDERGLTTTNTWDGLERLRRVDYPDGTYITNSYHWLDLVQVVDRMGFTNSYGYDPMRRLTDATNALGAVAHYEYCTCGSLESVRDALNNITAYYRDFLGRATNVVYPGEISVGQEFNLLGQLVSTTDAWGSTTNYYNNQGLLVAVSNAFGQVSQTIYDIDDRAITTVDANGVSIDMTYDDLGRVLTRSYPDDGVESFGYSASGLAHYTNQLGKVTHYGYDEAARKTAETNANTEEIYFTYNPAGDLLSLTDGKSQVTRWDYDEYGRVTSKVDDTDTEILRYGYDANGRLTNRWSVQKGNTLYSYDAAGNLTGVSYPASTNLAFSYDALNRLTNMVDAVGTTKYAYTALGQLQSEDGPWADDTVSYTYNNRLRDSLSLLQPNASAWSQSYGYDSAKRLTSVISPAGTFTYTLGGASAASPLIGKLLLPGGSYITNSYDSVARLLSTQLKNASSTVLNSHAYVYNDGNQRTKQTFTDGNYVNYTYDGIGQLKTARGKESGGVTNRLHEQFGYTYDAAGNLHYRTNNALLQTFAVNSLNELATVTNSGTLTVAGTTTSAATNVTVNSLAAEIYDDHTFARAGFTVSNGLNSFTAVALDDYGRVDTNSVSVNLPSSVSFQYDANGNLTNDGSRVFTYDDENQLTSVLVSEAWKSEFDYDGKMRRRVRREYTWSGSSWDKTNEVHYVYDGNLVIQERDADNVPQVSYTRGTDLSGTMEGAGGIGGLLARSDPSPSSSQLATAFYHADGNGNVTALINDNGLIVARYHYDPYGNTLSASGPLAEANLYRFSSKEWHANSGLYYYGYRYYDPNLQRWINRDPLGEPDFYLPRRRHSTRGTNDDGKTLVNLY